MNRPALLTLRVLAIGSALTVLGFLVVRRAATGTWAPSSKASSDPALIASWLRKTPAPAAQEPSPAADGDFEGFINYGTPIETTGVNQLGQSETIILGTKSAPVIRPLDIANARLEMSARQQAAGLLSQGVGLYDQGLYQDAAAALTSALQLDPDNTTAKACLERCRKALNPAAPGQPPAPAANAPGEP